MDCFVAALLAMTEEIKGRIIDPALLSFRSKLVHAAFIGRVDVAARSRTDRPQDAESRTLPMLTIIALRIHELAHIQE